MASSRFFRRQQLRMGGPGESFEWRRVWVLSCFFLAGMAPDRRVNVQIWGASGNETLRYGARAEIERSGVRAEGK